jgi:hypothetical protein
VSIRSDLQETRPPFQLFVFRGESFWGHDRIDLLEERFSDTELRL